MNSKPVRLLLLRLAGRAHPPRPMPAEPRFVLIIRPDHLGDLILAAPVLPLLRDAYPHSRLTAWLGPWGEPVWRHAAVLDAIETCPFPGFTRAPKRHPLAPYLLALTAARKLAGRFDLAINLRFDFWWGALAANWAGIPLAGYDIPECRPFLSLAVPYTPGRHETVQNVELVRFVIGQRGGSRRLAESEPIPNQPADLVYSAGPGGPLKQAGDEPPRYTTGSASRIAIHPGAGAEVKLWQEERWATVADGLAGQSEVVFTAGNSAEKDAAERIRSLMQRPATVLSGLSLDGLTDLYRGCRLVLGPDCGPIHLARAVGTPTVALFGPTNPAQFGPSRQQAGLHEVVRLPWRCLPCGRLDYTPGELSYHLCVKLIEPEQVLEAARRVLIAQSSRSC